MLTECVRGGGLCGALAGRPFDRCSSHNRHVISTIAKRRQVGPAQCSGPVCSGVVSWPASESGQWLVDPKDRPFYAYKTLSVVAREQDSKLYDYLKIALAESASSIIVGHNKQRYTTLMLMLHKHAKLTVANVKSKSIKDMLSVEFQGNPEAFFRQCSEKASALLQADVTPIDIVLTGIKEAENLPTALKYQIATDIEKEVVTQDNLMDKLHEYSAVLLGASGDIADTSANISQTDSFRSFRPRTDITQNTQKTHQYNTPFNPHNQTIATVCPRCDRPNMCVVGGCFNNFKMDRTTPLPKESKSALGRELGVLFSKTRRTFSPPTRDAQVVTPAPAEDANCNIAASPKSDKDSVVDELAALLLADLSIVG